MVRQILLMSGVLAAASAFAVAHEPVEAEQLTLNHQAVEFKHQNLPILHLNKDVRSFARTSMSKAPEKGTRADDPQPQVYWKRPAGQFWGTGFVPSVGNWFAYTPICLRPWEEYTFKNMSTNVTGEPTWDIAVLADPETEEYVNLTSHDQEVTVSYLWGEFCAAPIISYGDQGKYPCMYIRGNEVGPVEISTVETPMVNGYTFPVSSHYYSFYSVNPYYSQGLTAVNGLEGYPGMADGSGMAFGTNAQGFNAVATRFEKPERPYLLNGVQWFYVASGAVPNDIPLKAYVFKTAKYDDIYDLGPDENGGRVLAEGAELGDLIAESDSFIPASDTPAGLGSTVAFTFKETNPVTGATTDISLEIDDDIIIVVTGFDVDLGNGEYVTSMLSLDEFDEGYGNLGFMGFLADNEEGTRYALISFNDMFGIPSVAGVLADVSYPWLVPAMTSQPDDVLLPNEGNTTETYQGLQYALFIDSTSSSEDFDVTYDGEEECDWLSVSATMDYTETDPTTGEPYFTGISVVQFDAAPNPEDLSRTCKVELSIPAASYTITFRQGTKNTAVDVINVEKKAVYYDLSGRKVVNPDKGIYIKKAGSKTEKVIL
ncbi:MAG: hypothetical protein K2G85_05850 [Muribaculaceae bacterium]|nr:hypothetical protein [Muribaculaceae bacterium]